MAVRILSLLPALAGVLAGCEEDGEKPAAAEDAGRTDASNARDVGDEEPTPIPDAGHTDAGDADGQDIADVGEDEEVRRGEDAAADVDEPGDDAGLIGDAGDVGNAGPDVNEEPDAGPPVREGIRDHYAPLPFCSGRNIFTIAENKIVGFCGERPVKIYSAPIAADLSDVVAEPLLDLPQEIGGRDVFPTLIRSFAPEKFLLPMMNPDHDNAATFLMVDIAARTLIGPTVNATGLQIGTHPQGDPIPISALADFALIDGEFWGLLQNQNDDGTYHYGFGIALPQTEEGFPDLGTIPDEDGVFDKILSNRKEGIVIEEEPGSHFSFRTTHPRPTNIADLGNGLIAILNAGTADSPASVDIASRETHQLLPAHNISLGNRQLVSLPHIPLAVLNGATKLFAATEQSLWEVDLSEEAPREQQTEIGLREFLRGEIAAVALFEEQAIVGDSAGVVLFVPLTGANRGLPRQSVEVGRGLTHLAVAAGTIFVAVQNNIEQQGPHLVAVQTAP